MTFRFLASYAFYAKEDVGEMVAGFRREYGGPVEMFADSGAFSVATTGATLKLADYAAWLRDWREVVTTAATLDVIGDHVATARNTNALLDAGLNVLPTFHVGTPWPVLEDLCKQHRYVALGGMVPYNKRPAEVMRWLIRCFQIAREHGAVFHGFGMTRIATVAQLPFYSLDSSYWSSGVRYGRLGVWDSTRCRIVEVQIGRRKSTFAQESYIRTHGADPSVVLRPGFCVKAQRSPERYATERAMAIGVCATGWYRAGQWLHNRHRVTPPPSHAATGTVLFLADAAVKNLHSAARYLAAERCNDTPSGRSVK